jgi:beta-glucanase (GH16 family)
MKQELLKNSNKGEKNSFGGAINLLTSNYLGVRAVFLIMFILLPLIAQSQAKVETKPALKKTLVWSEEFNYNGLPDSTIWNVEVGKSRVNNEPQWYTKDLKNLRVANGMLTITCRKENVDGQDRYTSGRMNTRGKYSTTEGRIEARMKLPQGRGVWPAFWTLGLSGRWPACGEIDIMEYWGHNPNTVASNVHTGDYNHTKGTGRGGKIVYQDPFKDFHIYALEWFSDHMDFYFDNTLFYTCVSKGEGIGEWPFNSPQYIILNFALSNNWRPGEPGIDDSIFPQEFIVDYVRVYNLK